VLLLAAAGHRVLAPDLIGFRNDVAEVIAVA
jgi:hypothetical protein